MINLIANKKLKNLGCKWSGSEWIAPDIAKDEAQRIKDYFYSDLITVEIELKPGECLAGEDWTTFAHVRKVAGYIVASAGGRDTGARIADGVAVIRGKFTSGGSRKNFICDHTDDLILRMKVSRNALELLDQSTRFTYRVISDQSDIEKLTTEKESLLKRLSEIDKLLAGKSS